MRRGHADDGRRRGFTLIELLVVIAIIGVLMSLLLAAVMKTIGRIEEVKTRNDISQLSQAIEAFKTKYKVDYIPSRIKLRRQLNTYLTADRLEADSKSYLLRVWPRLSDSVTYNWNGTLDGVVLQGHECLVFFLGGIPVTGANPACTGFSTNPVNPTQAGGERNVFYDFQTNRLVAGPGGYLAYKDGYGKRPYAYFSAYKTENGYNRYASLDTGWGVNKSDCNQLGVWPYAESLAAPPRYMNANSFQIISAGRDALFGRGSVSSDGATHWGWDPRNPQSGWTLYDITDTRNPPQTITGADDLSNFTDRLVGIPVN